MTEQSHKREMNDALRGDFERLRARRQRRGRVSQALPVPKPERVVLTPPRAAAVEDAASPPETRPDTPPPQERPPSWLRSVLRRG